MVSFRGDSFRKIFREDIKAEIKALKKGEKSVEEGDVNRMREALDAIAQNKEKGKIFDGKMNIQLSHLKTKDRKLYMQYAKILTKKAGAVAHDPKMVELLKKISSDEQLKPIAKKIRQQLAMTQTLTTTTKAQEAKKQQIQEMQIAMQNQKEKFSAQKRRRTRIALGVGGAGLAGTIIATALFLPLGLAMGATLLFGGYFTRMKLDQMRLNEQSELSAKAKEIEYQTRIFEYSKTEAFIEFEKDNKERWDTNNPRFLELAYLESIDRTKPGDEQLMKLKAQIAMNT